MNQITKNAAAMLKELRVKVPLVHNITNYVTVNDCANAVLAIGASPIMADDIAEAGDIASIASALVINIGTLNQRTIASMIDAGKRANQAGVPVVLDPVGAGASKLRNETTQKLLAEVKLAVLRGNLSEVSFVAGLEVSTKGVDTSEADNRNDAVSIANEVAKKLGCVVAITGAVDTISDGENVAKIHNGHAMLSKVTGTGCMTSALVGSWCGACGGDYFTAAVGGVASMGISGEIAYEKAGKEGTGSFHMAIIDALSQLDAGQFAERAKVDEK